MFPVCCVFYNYGLKSGSDCLLLFSPPSIPCCFAARRWLRGPDGVCLFLSSCPAVASRRVNAASISEYSRTCVHAHQFPFCWGLAGMVSQSSHLPSGGFEIFGLWRCPGSGPRYLFGRRPPLSNKRMVSLFSPSVHFVNDWVLEWPVLLVMVGVSSCPVVALWFYWWASK